MKRLSFSKKLLVYVLTTLLVLPSYLGVGLLTASKAQAAAPIVTAANITVLGVATGTSGTFKIGDTVTGQFDDSGNNPADQATSVTINFSQFGGGVVSASETAPGNHIWQASYVIVNGTVDIVTADISVTATNTDGPTGPVSDSEDHSVDNQRPVINGAGSIIVVKHNSGNSNAAIGDQISFNIGSLVDTTGDATTFTANLSSATGNPADSTLAVGSTSNPVAEGTLNGSGIKFPVTATDNAGNTQSANEWTGTRTFDTVRPTLASANTETVLRIAVNFSEAIASASISPAGFLVSNPVRPVSAASLDGSAKVNLDTTSAFSPAATPTVAVTGVYDTAGNTIVAGNSIVASDGVKPQVGPDVEDLTFTEGKNDRDESLAVTFSEAIPTIGSTADYIVIYDADGDFSNPVGQRSVAVTSVSNPDNNQTVDLSIADQSGELDYNGKFQVSVNTSNVQDAGGNRVDTYANVAQSDTVSVFDSYTPTLLAAGLDPNSGLYGVGSISSIITVYATTDDGSNDQNLVTLSGAINGNPLSFTYDTGDNRYEASYVVTEGDSDATGLEALSIQLSDSAGNSSNVLSTSGNNLNIDANTPATPSVSDPVSTEIINADNRAISGTAEASSVVTIYTDPDNDGDKSDGSVVGSGIATGGAFAISVSLVQNADNNFLATSTDAAGNESTSSDIATITEDSILPVVSVNFPNGGELFAASTSVNITWTVATDAHLTATPISLYYSDNNSGSYNLIASNEANDGTYSWTAPDINSGQILVKVTASDEAGNIGEDISDAVFAIDNSLPTSQVNVFLQGQAYGPNTWDLAPTNGMISGTATDSPAGVASVSVMIVDPNGLYWNGAGWAGTSASVVASDTTNWSYALDKSNLVVNNGVYAIYSQATDTLGHVESTGTGSFVWDNQNPTVTLSSSTPNPTNGMIFVTAQFSETVTGFDATDVTAGNGAVENFVAVDGDTYTFDVNPTDGASVAVTIDVPMATSVDAAENANTASNQITRISDTVAPTTPVINIVATDDIINATERTATVTVTGTNESGSTVTLNGFATVVDTATTWHYVLDAATINAFGQGSETLTAIATDIAGNPNTVNGTREITVDTTAPTATIVVADTALKAGETSLVTITFDEAVTGFTNTDLTIANGTLTPVSSGDGGVTFTATLTPTADFEDSSNVITMDKTGVADIAGNAGVGTTDSNNYVVDTFAPTTPVINIVATDDIINATERTATVTVTGTNESGSTVTLNGQTATVTGTSWSFILDAATINAFGQGSETLTAIATDIAGNPNTINGTRGIVVDTTPPTDPVASPVAGNYDTGQSATLASSDLGSGLAGIYYTLDRTCPSNVSTLYTGAITVDHNLTLTAVAYDVAGNVSDLLVAVYGIAPVITNEGSASVTSTSATITWTTDHVATSRVVYDTVSHAGDDLTVYPTDGTSNYGYAFSTVEDSSVVTNHSVTITGLVAGTTYYFRVISHGSPEGSPEAYGAEKSFSTSVTPVVTAIKSIVASVVPSTSGGSSRGSSTSVSTTETPSVVVAPNPPTDEGKIKGDETSTASDDSFNWTPWIILIIIIALAGAATGGYFYWTRGEDIVAPASVVVTKKNVGKKEVPKKGTTGKKSNRW